MNTFNAVSDRNQIISDLFSIGRGSYSIEIITLKKVIMIIFSIQLLVTDLTQS